MNQKEQLKNELSGLRQLLETLEEEFNKGRIDDNGDLVLPEESNIKIKMLLEV